MEKGTKLNFSIFDFFRGGVVGRVFVIPEYEYFAFFSYFIIVNDCSDSTRLD